MARSNITLAIPMTTIFIVWGGLLALLNNALAGGF